MIDELAVAAVGSRPPHTGRPQSPTQLNKLLACRGPEMRSLAVWLVLVAGLALLHHSGVAALDVQANKEHNVRTPAAVGAALPRGCSLRRTLSAVELHQTAASSNGRCTPLALFCCFPQAGDDSNSMGEQAAWGHA